MSRRRRRREPIPTTLVLPSQRPSSAEIDVILMATDAVVGGAGRTGVTLILKGSRSKKVLGQGWDELEDYGALRHLTQKEIGPLVDWCIHHGWLRLERNRDGIPLLYHSEKGWKRVKRLWVARLLGEFEGWLAEKEWSQVWIRLESINRQIKLLLLQQIVKKKRLDLVPVMLIWYSHEVRAMRKAINETLEQLGLPTFPELKRKR